MGAKNAAQVNGRSISLPEACRTPEAMRGFLNPIISEFTTNLRACINRIRAHMDAQKLPSFEAPERGFAFIERTGEFSELPGLDDIGILSLDIFDTCLVRFLETPHDIFQLLSGHVERISGTEADEFVAQRIGIEHLLRQQGLEQGKREDTSIEAIYEELGRHFDWDPSMGESILNLEIFLERFFLRPVESMREYAWKIHKRGIPLVYTSEMYLPGSILQDMLNRAGFPVDKVPLYTSGEYGLSKGTGNLYRAVLQDTGKERLFHIGDNPSSDGEAPRGLGIQSAIIKTKKKVFPDLLSNVLHTATLSDEESTNEKFWESFGYRVAGPVHFAFASHLYRQCHDRDLKELYFLSRDGWFPQKVFRKMQEAWGSVAEDHYLYASREYYGIGTMSDIGSEEWDFILKPSPLLKTRDVFERLGIPDTDYTPAIESCGLPDKDLRICHHWGFKDPTIRDRLYAAVCECLPAFLEYRDSTRDSLVSYLANTGLFNGQAAFVDLGWNGSSAKALGKISPSKEATPAGLYFALLNSGSNRVSSYFTTGGKRMDLLKGSIALMEFLFGSPEPTVRRVELDSGNGEPLFRKPWQPHELAAWSGMESGIERYTNTCLEILANPPHGDGISFVEETLRNWLFNPNEEELEYSGRLSHSEGWGTDNRMRILPDADSITSEDLHREALCYCPWKPGLQRQLHVASSSAQRLTRDSRTSSTE